MSQYHGFVEGVPSPSPSPALLGVNAPQQQDPVSPRATERVQGASGNQEHVERSSDAIDISQALREIQRRIQRLNSINDSDQLEAATSYQQASLGVLTDIADDIAQCLICLRMMGSRNEEITRQEEPSTGMHSGGPSNTAPVLRRENAISGDHQTVCPASGISPHDELGGVAPPSVYYASGPYEADVGALGAYEYHLHPEISPQTYSYIQTQLSFPPSPGLYQTQWVQSPPVSPLIPSSFWHQHQHRHHHHRHSSLNPDSHHIRSPATFRGRESVPPPPNTTPNDTHQGTPLHGGQGQHQQQPVFPSPGAGVTMSFPLHYDTPAGPRMTLYHSYLPGHSSGPSSTQPVFREPGVRHAPVVSSAAVPELAAETPPPPQVSMGVERNGSSTHPSERFARADSDSEDSLVSPEETGFRWDDI